MGTSQSTAIINYEERYKSLVDQSVDLAIYFLSSTGIIESWNKGAEHFKQYKAEEVIGKHLSMFSTEEDKKKHVVEQELDEATQHGRFEGGGWRVRKTAQNSGKTRLFRRCATQTTK